MTDKDTADMINQCISEIQMLQAQVAALTPKAAAYDLITKILGLIPPPSQGYGIDIIWQLRKRLEELQPKVADAGSPA